MCSAAYEQVPGYWRNHKTEYNSFAVFKFFTTYAYWHNFYGYRFKEKGCYIIIWHFVEIVILSKFHGHISYMQMLRNRHGDKNIRCEVHPHLHIQDVVFHLSNCYLADTRRSNCKEICKPQLHTVLGFRNICLLKCI